MPFVIAWTRRNERQFISALSFSVISLSLTAGSLLGGFLPDVLPGTSLQTYRWTLVVGTAIAALGLIPMFLMGEALPAYGWLGLGIAIVGVVVFLSDKRQSGLALPIMEGRPCRAIRSCVDTRVAVASTPCFLCYFLALRCECVYGLRSLLSL